jgi:hypothetical protein
MNSVAPMGLRWRALMAALWCVVAPTAMAQALFPGPQIRSATTVTDPAGRAPELARLARAQNGRAVLVWKSGRQVLVQRLDADAQALGSPAVAFDFISGTRIDRIEVAASDDSHVIVVATSREGSVEDNLHVQRFTAAGAPIAQEWEDSIGSAIYGSVTDAPGTELCPRAVRYNQPAVSMDSAGNYGLTWSRTVYAMCLSSTPVLSSRVYYRYVPAVGAAPADPVLIYEVEIADPYNADLGQTTIVWRRPTVALADDGLAVVGWVAGVGTNVVRKPLLARRVRENDIDGAAFEVVTNQRYVEQPVIERAGTGFVAAWTMREETEFGLGRQRSWLRRLDADGALAGAALEMPLSEGLIAVATEADGTFTGFVRNNLGGWNNGRRFASDNSYLGHYYISGTFSSEDSSDLGPAALSAAAVDGDYLMVHRDGEDRLQVVEYGGPQGTKVLDFRASRTTVPVNGGPQDVLLRWASNAEGKCDLYGTWQGRADPAGSRNVGPWATPGDRQFQMVCPGATGPGPLNKTVTISVTQDGSAPAPTLTLTVSPATIALGESASLQWSSENAQGCVASGNGWVAGDRAITGSENVQPLAAGQFQFTLNCSGTGGEVEKTATLTVQGDATPDAFSFVAVNDAQPSTVVESEAVTVQGLNIAAAVSVAGGEYRIGNGAWTSAGGMLQPGETVQLRLTAAAEGGATRTATLTVGGVSASFSVTTHLPAEETSTGTIDVPGGEVVLSTVGGDIVNARAVPEPSGAPDDRSYPHGFFAFDIENVAPGASVTVQIALPAGSRPDRYVKCNAAGTSCSDFAGATFAANLVTLVLTDNGAGDNDPTPGRISDPGAPAQVIEPVAGQKGSGGAMPFWLWMLALLPWLRRLSRS